MWEGWVSERVSVNEEESKGVLEREGGSGLYWYIRVWNLYTVLIREL